MPVHTTAKRSGIRMTLRAKRALDKYATAHQMSRSEVIRDLIEGVLKKQPTKVPQRRSERVFFYDPEDLLSRLNAKAARLGIDGTDLLERAIEEALDA